MELKITSLGSLNFESPLIEKFNNKDSIFVSDEMKMRYNLFVKNGKPDKTKPEYYAELAGPRKKLHFDPAKAKTAIVTCGGLCPGLNDVIRSIVMETYYVYGSKDIIGIKFGYNGLNPDKNYPPVKLTPEIVKNIHMDGGTILGSSRGGTDDMNILLDTLERLKINILYTIGGDGTLRGAHKIAQMAIERNLDLAVVGIPKTIDNDIDMIQRSFGFQSAFSKAVDAISSSHVEAEGAPNGIGLVKLMGRHSGFIAANAALAMNDVNFILIPEIPFELHGENGLFHHLEKRLLNRKHAVICVAEGAGQDLMEKDSKTLDASGNVILNDIGLYLKNEIKKYFKEKNIEANIKYIDPSYIIRSTPATPDDSIFCAILGQNAVHAGMAGKTDLIVGLWNNLYNHVPIEMAVAKRKKINPNSKFWSNVIAATGQPPVLHNK